MAPDALTMVDPAYCWAPDHVATSGPECVEFAESLDIELDLEQKLALDVILAERADGKWAALEAVLVACRQNLKTFVFKPIALFDMFVLDTRLVTWTAHEFNTSREAFIDVKAYCDNYDHLRRRIKKITEANGNEGIELLNGQRLQFRARTKTGGRGLTGDRIFLDEAFALRPPHVGSLIPTLSAKSMQGNPQIVYGSSAGNLLSDVLRGLRDRGRGVRGDGARRLLAYLEWCDDPTDGECATPECDHVQGRPGCRLDDPERIRKANPALGRRISLEFIMDTERGTLTPVEFARERLGWWEDPLDETGFSLDAWMAGAVPLDDKGKPTMALSNPVVLAVDVAPNSASASIAACGGPVELIEHRPGTSWVIPRLLELKARHKASAIGLDATGPAGLLLNDLDRAGLQPRDDQHKDRPLVLLTGPESAQACGLLIDRVKAGEVRHIPNLLLDLAVAGARRRESGDTWRWSRVNSTVDISPLVAVTVAHFLWHANRKPVAPASAPPRAPAQGGNFFRPTGRLKL